jgi:hypothetical protein
MQPSIWLEAMQDVMHIIIKSSFCHFSFFIIFPISPTEITQGGKMKNLPINFLGSATGVWKIGQWKIGQYRE